MIGCLSYNFPAIIFLSQVVYYFTRDVPAEKGPAKSILIR